MDSFSTIEESSFLSRTRLLVGDEAIWKITKAKVIIFGVGGVGSWCAESLIRSGVSHLTIVDMDTVAKSNVNRQLQATSISIGNPKVEVLKHRLLEINPKAEINAIQQLYSSENSDLFALNNYDYVIDAIDSLSHKAHLILKATESGTTLFSSMGAALKLNPQLVKVDEFWKVKGCPLARALRKKFKQNKTFPSKKFLCVYSPELLDNKGSHKTEEKMPQGIYKPVANGTVVHITAVFGFNLAGLVIQDMVSQEKSKD